MKAPQVTATVGLLLMLATFASLILLVQHISTMLQAPNIAAAAGAELLDVVRAEIPDEIRSGDDHRQSDQQAPDTLLETEGSPVRVRDTGYIQYIDPEYVLTLVQERDLVIRLLHKPGHFVSRGDVVALVWPAESVRRATGGTDWPCLPDWKRAHAHPGCRIRCQPARRNGCASHVSGDQ